MISMDKLMLHCFCLRHAFDLSIEKFVFYLSNISIDSTQFWINDRSGRDFIITVSPIKETTNVCAKAFGLILMVSSPDRMPRSIVS